MLMSDEDDDQQHGPGASSDTTSNKGATGATDAPDDPSDVDPDAGTNDEGEPVDNPSGG